MTNRYFALLFSLAAFTAANAVAEGPITGGVVTGVVLDAQGKPIEGARIWVKPSITTGLVQARTDEEGRYRAEGLLRIPYNTYAWTRFNYHDQTLCMRLAPVKVSQYDSFVPTDGITRDFKLRISGLIDDRDDIYYGGEVRVFYQNISRDSTVVVRFDPMGPLADGSAGKALARSPKDMLIQDVPVGVYRVSAEITEPNGRKRQAKVSRKNSDAAAGTTTIMQWESKDSCIGSFGNGLDRAYLYIE